MAAPFSWSDTVKIAFSTCLPCFSTNPGASSSTESLVNPNDPTANLVRRARADELEGLLADIPDTDTEAEQMSLHSNPGRGKKRSKRRKRTNGKKITLFGYDLFGKPVPPPIHLPESDDEDSRSRLSAPLTTRSSSTFDSDAAPLDPATIASISSSSAELTQRALALEAEAAQRLEKEERRARRRERKEMKRIAKALAAQASEEFEGFQGSGEAVYQRPEEYGPFVQGHPPPEVEGDDDAADLDGGLYARRNNIGTAGSGSDSRSRTSASRSDQHLHPQQPSELTLPVKPKSKRSKTSSASGSKKSRSNTSASTSQSPSLPSPVSPSFPAYVAEELGDHAVDFPSQGFGRGSGFPGQGLAGSGGFPSQGFGGLAGSKRRDSVHAMGGAFLATRGGTIDG
ncbi:hypothetical protein BDZ94DRAFT_939547 [Collybia nuda]|uniref:Uncharacterized protein n=1 Tax=Collybia nuda TaxID=64659 RepID=A0A9P5Y2T1_9AGAR|nr:hypothetical protein BDZ94DRAFT_939547 [Collybia nuda]